MTMRVGVAIAALLMVVGCGDGSNDATPPSVTPGRTTAPDPTPSTTGTADVTSTSTASTLTATPGTTTLSTATLSDTTLSNTTLSNTAPGTTPGDAATTAVSSTAPAITCDRTDDYLTTPSGRRILLRAASIDGPAPTIFVIHGYTGTPTGIERISNMTNATAGLGITVAYPEGAPSGLSGFAWDTGASVYANSGINDVAALAEMVDVVVATGCVDRSRMVISGESNGGAMTLNALCSPTLATTFRSAVMVIPAIDSGVLARCRGLGPATSLVAVAGRIDRTTPFDGGGGFSPQLDWFADIVAQRGCTALEDPEPITANVDRYRSGDCSPCTELLAVADGPHTWPGTPVGNGGLQPGDLDLNRRIIADLLADRPGCLSDR